MKIIWKLRYYFSYKRKWKLIGRQNDLCGKSSEVIDKHISCLYRDICKFVIRQRKFADTLFYLVRDKELAQKFYENAMSLSEEAQDMRKIIMCGVSNKRRDRLLNMINSQEVNL